MNWLTWLLFESPIALGIVLGLVLFALLVHWRRQGQPRPLLIGLGAAIVLLIVQVLVVMPREHASRLLDAIQADFVRGRADVLAAALTPDFHAGEMDAGEFVTYVRARLHTWRVRWVERTDLQVQDQGAGRYGVAAAFLAEVSDGSGGSFTSRWKLTLVDTPSGWRLASVEPDSIVGQHLSWHEIARE
jgi:hypothetical protein